MFGVILPANNQLFEEGCGDVNIWVPKEEFKK